MMGKFSISLSLLLGISMDVVGLTVIDTTLYSQPSLCITWTDHKGLERKAGLVNSGAFSGVCKLFTYYDGSTRVILRNNTTPSATDYVWNAGFGAIVHHNCSATTPVMTVTQKFVGSSIAMFAVTATEDGVKESIMYTFMDGTDYFQYGLTDDATNGTSGGGDTRTPYSTIDYSGIDAYSDGVEYGAQKYFKQPLVTALGPTWDQRSGPYTFGGTCDIPYAWEWANHRELGFIQTQTWTEQQSGVPSMSSGGIPASGPHMSTYWGDPVPNTDYQMNFYDYAVKVTWGQPGGWMVGGGDAAPAMRNKWGQYSLSILFDSKADSGVMRIRDENRAVHGGNVTFTASPGTVTATGPIGTFNPATQTLSPPGFDHNYRAWWLTSDGSGQATMNLNITGATPLVSPVFRISSMTDLPTSVKLNNVALVSGTDYYASLDATNAEVWLCIAKPFTGNNVINVSAVNPSGLNVASFAATPSTVVNNIAHQISLSATVSASSGAVSSVTFDLTALGGGAAVAATKSGTTYSASFTVPQAFAAGVKTVMLTANNSNGGTKTGSTTVTVNDPKPVLQPLIIYTDAATYPGFTPVQNSGSTATEISTGASEGTKCYQYPFTLNNWWVAFDFGVSNGVFNLAGYDTIEFDFKGNGANLLFQLIGGGVTVPAPTNTVNAAWTTVKIPLNVFVGLDVSKISTIEFGIVGSAATGSGTMYVDNIRAVSCVGCAATSVAPQAVAASGKHFVKPIGIFGRTLSIANASDCVAIYDMRGSLLARVAANRSGAAVWTARAPGMYIVRIGLAESQRVMLR